MRIATRLKLVLRIIRWRLTWKRRELDLVPPGRLDKRFMTAREAARRIPDGACCLSTGMAGNSRCSTWFWAIRELFEASGRPTGLTWIAVGGQGGRGRVPGTVEELGLPGLLERFVTGHSETAKALLALADEGRLELHVLPQGEMCSALEAQAEGRESIIFSHTGVGTALDPRCGHGSALTPNAREPLIEAADGQLEFRLPRLDVAIIAAPWADERGNIYFSDAATITESVEAARAARANGGQVLVSVAGIIGHDADAIGIEAGLVDAVAVNPHQEQTAMVPQRRAWKMFTVDGDGDDAGAVEKLRFINRTLRITPLRGPLECALARLGAHVFARAVSPPACVNIGVGFGEEICRELFQSPLAEAITFTSETGVFGGMPAPGVYFGAAVNPRAIHGSAWMFRHYRKHLDAAVFGVLEFDASGNVNVSRRGPALARYVGAGGLPSIAAAAKTCIFVGNFMQDAKWKIERDGLRLVRAGQPKFRDRISEVSFNGREALRHGKQVWYVTTVGAFRLTHDGLVLEILMPGLDVARDVRPNCGADFALPEQGPETAPAATLSGRDYTYDWGYGLMPTQPGSEP